MGALPGMYAEREQLFVGDDAIRLLHESSLEVLPWRELAVDVVLDCTGVYGSREHGEAHLQAGAKKVLFSHHGGNDLDATVVLASIMMNCEPSTVSSPTPPAPPTALFRSLSC